MAVGAGWQNWLWQGGRIDNVLFLRKKVPGLGISMREWVGLQSNGPFDTVPIVTLFAKPPTPEAG